MLQVRPIPAFDDNYIWLLTETDDTAVVVDPGDADPVLELLRREGRTLTAVLVTHHHYDHTGGIPDLLEAFPNAQILGPADPRIRTITHPCREGDEIQPAGLATRFEVMEVPGHTASHIAYFGDGKLFCGDTLFAAGCGRVFDGTFEQLAQSLERIAALPPDSLCYCAHEYTLANLGFAKWVEPDSAALVERIGLETERRQNGQPTVPAPLALELSTNPFLRVREPQVMEAAAGFAGRPLSSGAEVFTALRRWKDERYD